jgi:hypothetical protein
MKIKEMQGVFDNQKEKMSKLYKNMNDSSFLNTSISKDQSTFGKSNTSFLYP